MIVLHPMASEFVLLASLDICAACLKRGAAKRCAACKCSKYCSADCQKSDWKNHKNMCSSLKEALDGWNPCDETKTIVRQTEDETEDEKQQPGYDLFSKGLDLQSGMKDFLKGYPDSEKMGGKIERNPEEGNTLIMEAAKLGIKGAQYVTALNYLPGGFYHDDNKCKEDLTKEVHEWIEKAALSGHAEAQVSYGNKLWIQGNDGSHPIDLDKGLFWLRKALAHGVTDGGDPDPMGNALSEKSFRSTLDLAVRTARRLYLTKYALMAPEYCASAPDNDKGLCICADCGVGGALANLMHEKRET